MNHNLQLLQRLYSTASGKYVKFKVRLDKAIHNGTFHKLTKRKQATLLSRVKKLYQRLQSLQTQLRLAGATAAFALTLSLSNVQGQSTLGPFERNDAANPFQPPINFNEPRPAIVDIDNDGDQDVFVGTVDGSIKFFRNVSPANSVTRFIEVTGSANPLNGVNKGFHVSPAFADVDADGDFDLLIGIYTGATFFFRNTGSLTSPVFQEQTGAANPFDGITGTSGKYGTSEAQPTFVNLDGDADVDLFIGGTYRYDYLGPHGAVQYFENNAGVFTAVGNNLATELTNFYGVKLAFFDKDGDGDLDAFVGSNYYSIACFRQDTELTFTRVYGGANPFDNFYFSNFASPATGDLDSDGDLDFLVGNGYYGNPYFGPDKSNVRYFENNSLILSDRNDLNISPFGGVDVGNEAAPVFVDLDGDEDLDVVIGSKYSSPDDLFVYINNDGIFEADPNNQIVAIVRAMPNSRQDIIPVFVDIDNDSDQDMFICRGYGINFFRNNAGTFEPATNPLDPGVISEVSITFIDVDNDNDFDAFVSSDPSPKILYFQNNGTPANPNFVSATQPVPFATTDFEDTTNILAVDLDNDGDLDLLATERYYNGFYGDSDASRTRFFENKGGGVFEEASAPVLIELTPSSFTSFVDIDGDGDLDAFVGNGESFYNEEDGKVFFFENTNPPPVTNINTSTLTVTGGEPTILDPLLSINDPDNDDIARAIVTISDYVPGDEELVFDSDLLDGLNITGDFDDETGVLTFIGVGSIESYEEILRSVAINFTGDVPGGRKSSSGRTNQSADLAQDVTFQVRDTDFTLATISVVSINIISGGPATEIEIYNAVSPNTDDNLNRFFNIRHIETVSPENKVTIYNRWGDIVYEVSGYNNTLEDKRFNGTSDNGKELPTGTYFYKIEITGQTLTGYLSLKR